MMSRAESRDGSQSHGAENRENDGEEQKRDRNDDSLSEYRDENAEPDEVDENSGNPIVIKVKKLHAHEMNIKQIDKVHRCQTQAIDLSSSDEEEAERADRKI